MPSAATVRAVLTVLVAATPCWPASRPLLAPVRTAPPARWAAIPARFKGVQRAQPLLATRSRWVGSWTTEAAPLTPVAPISEPPNQLASPRSCRVRATVLSVGAMPLVPFGCSPCSNSRGVRAVRNGCSMAAVRAPRLMLRGSGAPVGKTTAAGGSLRRPEGDGQPGDRTHQVQTVVGAVEGQEVDVGVAGREQPVDEGQAVAGGQQPAIGPGRVQPPPQRQSGQPDGQVDEVVQGVDLEAEQGLVGLGGEVVQASDEEAEKADQGVDGADGQGQQLAGMPGGGSGIGTSSHERVLLG